MDMDRFIRSAGAVIFAMILAASVAPAKAAPASDAIYNKVQSIRVKAAPLWHGEHPSHAGLIKARDATLRALDELNKPLARGLAYGDFFLFAKRMDVEHDLAHIYARLGNKEQTLAHLRAILSVAWFPPEVKDLESSPDFKFVRKDPRLQAMLATLHAAYRQWNHPSLATGYKPTLSVAERIAGLSLFWSEANYNFAHFDHVANLDWDKAYLDFLPKVIAARTTREYYDVLMRFAPLLDDGHTKIYAPERLAEKIYARPPLRSRLVQNKVVITAIASPAILKLGISVGDVVEKIDGTEVHAYAEKHFKPYASSSTPQDMAVRLYDYMLFSGEKDKALHLTLQKPDGREREVTVPRSGYTDVHWPQPYQSRPLGHGIYYFSLDSFENDAGVKAFEKALPAIMKSSGLIIDMRKNDGGSSAYGWQVLSYLTHGTIPTEHSLVPVYNPLIRAQFTGNTAWYDLSGSMSKKIPRKSVFDGPVVVLIGAQTFSAGEDFIVSFKAMKRGLLVGQATAGSTGQPLMFKLPGGGAARICVKRDSFPDGTEFVGKGIAPDIEVKPTVADIRAGKDPALERAEEALIKELRR